MRLAVISDLHVMGPGEHAQSLESVSFLGHGLPRWRGQLRRGLNGFRNQFWHSDADSRQACFHRALEKLAEYQPDWVVVNGDYGGDHRGVGLSDDHTFESVSLVLDIVRAEFPGRVLLVFGDHDIGKYSTIHRHGGIRLKSLARGEEDLGISSFWDRRLEGVRLVGVNSSLLSLHLFLPEALPEEIGEWERRRRRHLKQIRETFGGLPAGERVILFCHDPSALAELDKLPEVRRRLAQVEMTVVGHLHAPGLLRVHRMMRHLPAHPGEVPDRPDRLPRGEGGAGLEGVSSGRLPVHLRHRQPCRGRGALRREGAGRAVAGPSLVDHRVAAPGRAAPHIIASTCCSSRRDENGLAM